MKKSPIFLWVLLACFVVACAGVTAVVVNPFSVPSYEEPVSAQYTVTFKRSDQSSANYSEYLYVRNLTQNTSNSFSNGGSKSQTTYSGDWICVSLGSLRSENRWVYATGINGNGSTVYGVNELYFQITSSCTVTFGVQAGECHPFQGYHANGGSLESTNVSQNRSAVACYLNGRYYRKNTAEQSLIGWRQRQEGWTGALLVGKTASSVQMYTTGDYSSTTTDYLTFSYDSNGDGTSETWYVLDGGPDYNYHTDQVSYSGGRSFVSLGVLWEKQQVSSSWNPTVQLAKEFLDTYKTFAMIMNNTYYFPYADPTREHYMFAGWYTAATGGTRVTEGTSVPSYYNALYAHWTPNEYVVELEWPDEYTSETVTAGGTYTMPDGINSEYYSHAGYHIDYWEDDYGNTYVAGETYSVIDLANNVGVYYDGDTIYLYAHEAPNVYTLEFNANGGTGTIASQTRTYGETVTLPSSGFSKTGYTLSGWKNEDGTLFSIGATYSVSDLAGSEVNTNGATITLYAQWTINTYTLSFSNGYYYSSSGYSVSLTAPGCTITNATLTQSNHTSTVSHTYSTTPVTVTLTRNDSHLWLYVDGVCVNAGDNSISWSWSPTASHTAHWYIREFHDVSSNTSEGIASATYSVNSNSPGGGSHPSNATSMEILEGTILDFKATLKNGYVFDGWYNGSTRVSTNATYSGVTISNDLTLTAKATKIYNMVQYDSTNKYFYFEDGVFPQTYVGDSMNSTLKSWLSSSSPSSKKRFYIKDLTSHVYTYSDGKMYVNVYCPTTYTVKLKSGSNKTFSAGSYYWFVCEPIRWRVSEYGVGIDYYTNTLYSRFVSAGGVVGVSQYILDYDKMCYSGENDLGDKYTGMNIHRSAGANGASNVTTAVSTNKVFDIIGNGTTNTKIEKETITYSGIAQVSLGEMEHIGLTALEAPVTDLTAMLSGTSYGKNLKYSTRDLYDNQNSKCVTEFGIIKNRWLDGLCGIRYSFVSTGKSS